MMNPMQLMQMMNGASNPMQTLMQASGNNPMLRQVMQMTNGKTPDQMRQMAQQMAQQRGLDINQIAQQMGIRLPL